MEYKSDAAIYHGPPFRCLKGVYCQYDGGFGRLIASELGELGGARQGSTWIVPGALLDGSMVACSTFMYAMFNGRVEIPQGIDRLRLGRHPRAGEECILRFYFAVKTRAALAATSLCSAPTIRRSLPWTVTAAWSFRPAASDALFWSNEQRCKQQLKSV